MHGFWLIDTLFLVYFRKRKEEQRQKERKKNYKSLMLCVYPARLLYIFFSLSQSLP